MGEYLTNSTHDGEAHGSFHFTDGVESYFQDIISKISITGVVGELTKSLLTNVEKKQKYPIEYTFKSIGSTAKNNDGERAALTTHYSVAEISNLITAANKVCRHGDESGTVIQLINKCPTISPPGNVIKVEF